MYVSTWRKVLEWLPLSQLLDTLCVNWHLGLTSFGGPPFHDKFVKKIKWIDEQLYQELFSVCQALSGPGSTKMLYCINLIRHGTLSAIFSLLIWSLPAATALFGLSLGVARIDQTLPSAVYALLSGLNAAVVGVIALAAVELARQAGTDKITKFLIFISGSAGLLYNALWYFPLLITICGITVLVFDLRWIHRPVKWCLSPFRRRTHADTERADDHHQHEMNSNGSLAAINTSQTNISTPVASTEVEHTESPHNADDHIRTEDEPRVVPQELQFKTTWKVGCAIIILFLLIFLVFMVLRGTLANPPLLLRLFTNMFLAGTIIFGGGPVVIPLLAEYVVAEGWVSPRDFLIGLALVQAFPGPNFNFAVFLGGLTAINNGYSPVAGAVLAWLGIFSPGLVLVHGTTGIWSSLRSRRWFKSLLRGLSAGATGLIFTAVYRLWQAGYIDREFQSGRSLGDNPWWVVVAATSYVAQYWFKVPVVLSIGSGAVLGLVRYAVVSR